MFVQLALAFAIILAIAWVGILVYNEIISYLQCMQIGISYKVNKDNFFNIVFLIAITIFLILIIRTL